MAATPLKTGEAIRVACRARPLNSKEVERKDEVCLQLNKLENSVQCSRECELNHTFPFDYVFGNKSNNEEVYEELCAPIIESVLDGVNGSVMAYGQTGSGKTYTMFGNESDPGIVVRSVNHLYSKMNELPSSEYVFQVRMSVLEIYQNKIFDLASAEQGTSTRSSCRIRLAGFGKKRKNSRTKLGRHVVVEGATQIMATGPQQVMAVLAAAEKRRMAAETKMNQRSSRSHCVVVLSVAKQNLTNQRTKLAQLYLVDLAGSENASKTAASGMRLDEAKEINKSLTTLGRVIDCLINKAPHIPYRDSNLTRLLANSLGGNARCALCVNVSPSSWNYAESLSTLFFGCRTRAIKNKPKTNAILSVGQLSAILEQYNSAVRENSKAIRDLDNQLEDLSDFFDILRTSPEGKGLLLGNTHSSVLRLKRESPELLLSRRDKCSDLVTDDSTSEEGPAEEPSTEEGEQEEEEEEEEEGGH